MGSDLWRSAWTYGIHNNANDKSHAPSTGRNGRWYQVGCWDADGAYGIWSGGSIGLRFLCLRTDPSNLSKFHAPDPLAALRTDPRPLWVRVFLFQQLSCFLLSARSPPIASGSAAGKFGAASLPTW